MKKILFLDTTLNTGGAERIFCTLIRNIDRTKYKPLVIITGTPGEMAKLIPPDVRMETLHIRRSRFAIWRLARILAKEKPDVIFSVATSSITLAFFAKIASGLKIRLVFRYCIMPMEMIKQGFCRPRSLGFRLEKFILNRLDCIVTEHRYMEQEVQAVFGVPPEKTCAVLNPLDQELIDRSVVPTLDSPFPADRINVVAAGRLNREKGFDFLIESFRQCVQHNSKFHLYIIGMNIGDNQEQLRLLASRLGIENHVHFEGYQENPFLYFKHADLFVLSSRWEASPNVVFENLYLGKKVVATNCSPILKDLIDDNGRLVTWGNIEEMAQAILAYPSYTGKVKNLSDLNAFYSKIAGE